ncbi:MAG: response regulator [Oligoflexales bacterium]|nr:response regulator [Oligoflexales bacterium]
MDRNKVLVVDDSPANIDLIRTRFSREPFEIFTADEGKEALRLLRKETPDIILLDFLLPDLSGLEVLEEIRRYHTMSSLPVIMLSATDDDKDIIEALRLGANDYVLKPISFQVLLARMMVHLKIKADDMLLMRQKIELKEKSDRIESQNLELERSNKALSQFAYIASHDLQEPVRKISCYCDLIEDEFKEKLGSYGDEYITKLRACARRMLRQINDLLAYSRVGRSTPQYKSTNANEVFDRVVDGMIENVAAGGIKVTRDQLPFDICIEDCQLESLFQNFLSNGIKFRDKEEPMIHVSSTEDVNGWMFSFKDNGIGIAPEHHERVFDIFQKLHPEKEYPGTGIGLAICKRIVENYGGKIWVNSEDGNGSEFCFSIPKLKALKTSGE